MSKALSLSEILSNFQEEIPHYLTREELMNASADCLNHEIVETDIKKIKYFMDHLKSKNEYLEEEISDYLSRQLENNEKLHSNLPCGYFTFNKGDVMLIFNNASACFLEEAYDYEHTSSTYILCLNPLIISYEVGHVFGYLRKDNEIIEELICAPDQQWYDWIDDDELTGKPFLRKP